MGRSNHFAFCAEMPLERVGGYKSPTFGLHASCNPLQRDCNGILFGASGCFLKTKGRAAA